MLVLPISNILIVLIDYDPGHAVQPLNMELDVVKFIRDEGTARRIGNQITILILDILRALRGRDIGAKSGAGCIAWLLANAFA